MKTIALALTLGALALAGCGSSPPTQFYQLTPTGRPPARAGIAGAPVRVAAVHLPETLDRLEMVSGLDANRLDIRGEDRWAAPLDDMTRRVLARDLGERLADGAVIGPKSPAPRDARQLVVDLEEFGVGADGRARLRGAWTLIGPDQRPLLRREVDVSEPSASNDPAAQAAAMSGLLGRLADELAAALASRS